MSEEEIQEQPKKSSGASAIREVLIVVVLAVVLAFLITHFIAEPYKIPSSSMEETIMTGDRIISEKITYYFEEPEQGDIVTFTDVQDPDRTLIKRVIAVAGQTVDIKDGAVYVDGEKLDEPYLNGKITEDPNTGIEYPQVVEEGHVWVMGDNRPNSADSRWFGQVPVENINGKAVFRYWPLSSIGGLD